MVLESSRLKPCWSKKAVEDFLQRQKVIITTDQSTLRRPWTLSQGIYVDKLYQHIQYFAADLASSALSEMFPLSSGINNGPTIPPPSASEIRRMERTFFRFELYCNLFRNYRVDRRKRFTAEEQMEVFLNQFPPWEVEQLACVRDYLLRYIADGMPSFLPPPAPDHWICLLLLTYIKSIAFNDVAEHDIVWGLGCVDFIDYGRSPILERDLCCREHFLSIGLEYLHHLGSAKTYDERYKLLSPTPFPESDRQFLESALQAGMNEANGPDYWLDGYTPEDLLLLKNKPFASSSSSSSAASSGGDGDDDSDSGPYEAWRWAYAKYDHLCLYFADEHWYQRRKAYVMWDLMRLSEWEPFQQRWDETDWGPDLLDDEKSFLRRVEARWVSRIERERIFNLGGSGWWALGDESKIQWGHSALGWRLGPGVLN